MTGTGRGGLFGSEPILLTNALSLFLVSTPQQYTKAGQDSLDHHPGRVRVLYLVNSAGLGSKSEYWAWTRFTQLDFRRA